MQKDIGSYSRSDPTVKRIYLNQKNYLYMEQCELRIQFEAKNRFLQFTICTIYVDCGLLDIYYIDRLCDKLQLCHSLFVLLRRTYTKEKRYLHKPLASWIVCCTRSVQRIRKSGVFLSLFLSFLLVMCCGASMCM